MNVSISSPVLIERFFLGREITGINNIALALLGSIFIALTAQVALPLPFSPVPITGQTFGVLVSGIVLGAKRGALSAVFYIVEGAIGLPVFAGLKGGVVHLLGPTGGYILGFVPAAYIAGYLAEKGWDRSIIRSILGMSIANAIIYGLGLFMLSFYIGYARLLELGFYPYIAGDLLKIALAALSIPLVWKVISR